MNVCFFILIFDFLFTIQCLETETNRKKKKSLQLQQVSGRKIFPNSFVYQSEE